MTSVRAADGQAETAERELAAHRAGKACATAFHRRSAPKRTGSSQTRPVSRSTAAIASRASSSSAIGRVLSAIAATGARPDRRRDRLVRGGQLRERRDQHVGPLVDGGRARLVAEHERVGRAAVQQPERDAGVARVQIAPCPSTSSTSPRVGALEHEPLGSARDVVGDHVVDGDAPARDRDADLAGGHEHRLRRPASWAARVELERHGHLADRAVGADRVHDARGQRRAPRRSASRARRERARRSRSSSPRAVGGGDELGVARRARRAAPPRRACPSASASSSAGVHSGRQLAAGRRDADREALRAERGGLGDRGDDRHAACRVRHDLVRGAPACVRVDDAHDRALAVADQAVRGLAVRRVQERLGEDRDALARTIASGSGTRLDPEPGTVARARCARPRARAPRTGSSEMSRWPSRSTKSQSDANCAAGAMPSELSIMQPSMTTRPSARAACIMRTASRMPPRLRELDVDAVGVARDHRRRRAGCGSPRRSTIGMRLLERRAARGTLSRSSGRERLLDQLDAELELAAAARAPPRGPSPRWRRRAAAGRVTLGSPRSRSQVVRAAELDLEPPVARLGRAPRAVGRALDRVDADRVRRLGGRPREPEDPPRRLTAELADQIVQRSVDRARAACWPGSTTSRSLIASSANGSSPSIGAARSSQSIAVSGVSS